MDPALGGKVVERQQLLDVVGDLLHRLGPFRAVDVHEDGDRLEQVLAVLGVVDVLQSPAGSGLRRLRQGVDDIGCFMNQAPLVTGLGKDLREGSPEAERAVTDGQDRGAHPVPGGIAQQVGP